MCMSQKENYYFPTLMLCLMILLVVALLSLQRHLLMECTPVYKGKMPHSLFSFILSVSLLYYITNLFVSTWPLDNFATSMVANRMERGVMNLFHHITEVLRGWSLGWSSLSNIFDVLAAVKHAVTLIQKALSGIMAFFMIFIFWIENKSFVLYPFPA